MESDSRKFLKELQRSAPPPPAPPPKEKSEGKPAEKPPAPKIEWPKQLTLVGSLNGLTYLWQPVADGQSGYFDLHANGYMRPPIAQQQRDATIGFRAGRQYDRQGKVVSSGGRHYFLSTMLEDRRFFAGTGARIRLGFFFFIAAFNASFISALSLLRL